MKEENSNADSILKIITIIIYLIFICSVTYNYAYLWALGLSPSQIPLNISDIVNSAFTWAPTVTILSGVGLFFVLLTRRVEHGKTEEEIVQSTENPELWRKIRQSPFTLFSIMGLFAFIYFIIVGQEHFSTGTALSAFTSFAILWFCIGEKLSDTPLIRIRRSILIQLLIVFSPIIIGFFLALGYDDAINQVSNSKATGLITLNNTDKFSAILLRSFDKGILFKDIVKKEITFLPWPDIKRIDIQCEKKIFYKGFLSA